MNAFAFAGLYCALYFGLYCALYCGLCAVGYPVNAFAFALSLNLGNNEFGAFNGYTHIDIPTFHYDQGSQCLAGTPRRCASLYSRLMWLCTPFLT